MIKAMDILHTAERLISNDQSQSGFIVPGAYVTADVPGSGSSVYNVLSLGGRNFARVKNLVTGKLYQFPMDSLSVVLVDDPFDDNTVGAYRIKRNEVPRKTRKDDQPETKKSRSLGDILSTGQPPYSRSRYDKTGMNPE